VPISHKAQPARDRPPRKTRAGKPILKKATPSGSKNRVPAASVAGPKSPARSDLAGPTPSKCELVHNRNEKAKTPPGGAGLSFGKRGMGVARFPYTSADFGKGSKATH
jgi:hypothetical protein